MEQQVSNNIRKRQTTTQNDLDRECKIKSLIKSFKRRSQTWSELIPDARRSLREDWGDYMNDSYPFEVGNEEDFTFLDSFKSW